MWRFEIAPRVDAYLDDFQKEPLVMAVHIAIVGLAFSDDGLPSEGEVEDCGDGYHRWLVHHHTLILQIIESDIQGYQQTDILYIADSEIRSEEETKKIIASLTE